MYDNDTSNLSNAQASIIVIIAKALTPLEEFGFPDITLRKSKARKHQKKSKHSQCADLRQWLIPSVLVGVDRLS